MINLSTTVLVRIRTFLTWHKDQDDRGIHTVYFRDYFPFYENIIFMFLQIEGKQKLLLWTRSFYSIPTGNVEKSDFSVGSALLVSLPTDPAPRGQTGRLTGDKRLVHVSRYYRSCHL